MKPAGRTSDPLLFLPSMMTYLVLILQFVCLSLWIGGTTVLLTIVAPSAFRTSPLEGASELVALIMRRYNGLLAFLQVFLLATLYLQLLLLSDSIGLKLRIALSLTSLATLLTVYLRFTMLPGIEALRSRLHTSEITDPGNEEIRRIRRAVGRSMMLLTVNLFLGLCVVITLILPF
ncbi:MAG TPA: DUF4149 domain-containing protein [Bacteroidota bacterium]|nr:DUF4149 domain-containing protein [Bacteroidota bacterium]